MGQEIDMTAAILLGLDIAVILAMLVGFIVVRVGPASFHKRVADFYAHSIVHHVIHDV